MRSTAISTTAPCFSAERNLDDGGGSDDDGPFYDLEFAVPLESGDLEKFSTNVSSWGHRLSSSFTSLTEEILFKGHLFAVESSSSSPSSLLFSTTASGPNSKSQFPASVLKSATKLRIFMFRTSSKIVSNKSPLSTNKFIKVERRDFKDVILRYIRKIKPLYVKVSKLSFSVPPGRNKEGSTGQGAGVKKQSKTTGSGVPSRFKVVPGLLRKSRSASSAVASVFSTPMTTPRRDDSLMQQEDGIRAAIAHCKRSFHSEKELWTTESPLLRSMSDPGGERSVGHGRSQGIRGGDSTVR